MARSDTRSFDSGADVAPMPGQDAGERDFFDPEEYLGSFSALRDSMAQGRDLKKKRKALDEYKKTLDTLRKAYEDRVNIARNYDAMITDQEHIIAATNTEIQRATRGCREKDRRCQRGACRAQAQAGQGAQAPRGGARLPKRGARLRQG